MKTKPIQRTLSLISALAMILTVFAVPAFAAPSATAELTAGSVGFPSPDSPRSFSVNVTNTEGGNLLTTAGVDFVSITLPAGSAGVVLGDSYGTPPSGWTVTAIDAGRLQVLEYRASSPLSELTTGDSETFTFPALVNRPKNTELTGTFRVDVSTNGGTDLTSASATGNGLDTTVEVLEMLSGSDGLRPTAPEGVTDRTATAGQTVSYSYSVRNHAADPMEVSGTLSIANDPAGTTTIADPVVTRTIAGIDGVASFAHTGVTLGGGQTDRTVSFQADALRSAGGADAGPANDALEVWLPSTLDVAGVSPIRTRATRTEDDGTVIQAFNTFTVEGRVSGTPDLDIQDGTFEFATTTAGLNAAESSSDKLTFGETEVTGADGQHPVLLTLEGVDENGFAYAQQIVKENPSAAQIADIDLLDIIIDTLAPDVTIDVTLPTGQSAVKNGDKIGVTGTIAGTDVDLDSLRVFLDPDVGDNIEISNLSTSGKDTDGDGENDTWDFSGSASPVWNADARKFGAVANVLDIAGNAGTAVSDLETVDNIIPELLNPGRTGKTASGESYIKITFADAYAGDLRGGCDPNIYGIDGVPATISEVRFSEDANTVCSGDDANGSGVRYLILKDNLEPTETPKVTYLFTSAEQTRSLGLVPMHDGAINDAPRRVIDTIAGIVPDKPEIIEITRNAGSEIAVQDEEKVFTRFGGSDLEVEFTIPGSGYTIQVVENRNGQIVVLHQQGVASPDRTNLQGNGTDYVPVPLPELAGCDADGNFCTTDGLYERGLRFVAGGPTGEIRWLTIDVDTVPLAFTATATENVATVTFNDVVWDGTDAARDWFAYENITVEGQAERDYYRAQLVESPDRTSRTLTFAEGAVIHGIEYLRSSSSTPYVDRAGNEQPNTLS